ncbi:hypothetical protein CRENBAI_003639 [Crenichthys baileyi]|uniref:Uncharacterized protein n=1 Tax=Crenichthys baileyi TaxID=28760 RepID=A0AAV9RGV2_9TELE
MAGETTLHNRLTEDMQHLAANTKGHTSVSVVCSELTGAVTHTPTATASSSINTDTHTQLLKRLLESLFTDSPGFSQKGCSSLAEDSRGGGNLNP